MKRLSHFLLPIYIDVNSRGKRNATDVKGENILFLNLNKEVAKKTTNNYEVIVVSFCGTIS